jgi:methionine synthase I (cobalamin-dependent)
MQDCQTLLESMMKHRTNLLIKEYLNDNLVNIIGGCCGTSRTHLIADIAEGTSPEFQQQRCK